MRWLFLLVLALLAFTANGGSVFECRIDGHTVFQGTPCPEGTTRNQIVAPATPQPKPKSEREGCDAVSHMAKTVMQQRQQGMSISEMMKHDQGQDWIRKVMMDAYDEPRYSTSEYQQETIVEFSNKYHLLCLRGKL